MVTGGTAPLTKIDTTKLHLSKRGVLLASVWGNHRCLGTHRFTLSSLDPMILQRYFGLWIAANFLFLYETPARRLPLLILTALDRVFVWEIVIRTAHSLKHLVHQKAVLMDGRPLSAQSSFYSGYLIHVRTLEHLSIGSLRRMLWGQASPQQDAALAFPPDISPCLLSSWIIGAAHALAYTWRGTPPISSFHPKLLLKHGTFSSSGLSLVWEYIVSRFLEKVLASPYFQLQFSPLLKEGKWHLPTNTPAY